MYERMKVEPELMVGRIRRRRGGREHSLCSLSLSYLHLVGDNSLGNSSPLYFARPPKELSLPRCSWNTQTLGPIYTYSRVDPSDQGVKRGLKGGWEKREEGERPGSPSPVSTVYLARCRYFVRPNEWL